jgi:hypothetical protein
VPEWAEFEQPLPDGSPRVPTIAVDRTKAENGEMLSLVTHIKQPSEGAWISVRPSYDGLPYSRLTKYGQQKKLSEKHLAELTAFERDVYELWTTGCSDPKWTGDAGRLMPFPEAGVAALRNFHRPQYKVARIKAAFAK